MKKVLFSLSIIFIITFAGCGGGGDSSSSNNNTPDVPTSQKTITGTFVDSPVQGLKYVCSSGLTGTTNSKGEYICNEGDNVTFSLGNITIGTVKAQTEFITPYSLFPDNNEAAANFTRLLQTLDTDENPDNDIILSDSLIENLPDDLDFTSNDFESETEKHIGKELRSKEKALEHLHNTISNANSSSTEFDATQKHYLYNLFTTQYFWNDKISSNIKYSHYSEPQQMINGVKYSKFDKWSYSSTISDYENNAKQSTTGIGCRVNNNDIFVYALVDSPCDKADVRRGDKVIVYYTDIQKLFVYRNGQYLYIPMEMTAFNYKVTKTQIIEQNNKKIGHMIYNSFTSSSIEEIEEAFTKFDKENIDELIIDLRYNGGGSLATASILLDKIAGYGREDALQAKINWNNGFQSNNKQYSFSEDENSLKNINKVIFLTTKNTASASEMLINSLKPYMDVVVIGDTTHGKPVGMQGKKSQGLIYWLINFELTNANGEGGYFDGITPTCNVTDNLNYERTDINGSMLGKALSYIKNDGCYENLTNTTYNTHGVNYYTLSLENNATIDFNLNYGEEEIIIYDKSMNQIKKINFSSTILLDKGDYIIKINNKSTASSISIFSNAFDTSNLENLSNKAYKPNSKDVSYHKFTITKKGKFQFDLINLGNKVTIFDNNMTQIHNIDSSSNIILDEGTYFVKLNYSVSSSEIIVFSTLLDTSEIPTLANGTYKFDTPYYTYIYKFTTSKNGKFIFDLKHPNIKIIIYDTNMNQVQTIASSSNIKLDADSYFVKISTDYSSSSATIFSTVLNTSNIPELKNQTYNSDNSYFKLNLLSDQNISFYPNSTQENITIYDNNMTQLQNVTSSTTISLNSGLYFVKLENKFSSTIYSSILENNYENLINTLYKTYGQYFYNLTIKEKSNIDFNIYGIGNEVIIYDTDMNQIKKINSTSNISLDKGSYIVGINIKDNYGIYVYSTLFDTSNTANLKDGVYTHQYAKYFDLNITNAQNVIFDLDNDNYKKSVTIYDTNMSKITEVTSTSTVKLNSSSYIVKIYNNYSGSTSVSSSLFEDNTTMLNNGIYNKSNETNYYKLDMKNKENIDFYLTDIRNTVIIYDTSFNQIKKINSSTTISLNAGSYIVSIYNYNNEFTSIYSPILATETMPELVNGIYNDRIGYYKITMPSDGLLDLTESDSRNKAIILDSSFKLLKYASTGYTSLNAGSYIIRIYNHNSENTSINLLTLDNLEAFSKGTFNVTNEKGNYYKLLLSDSTNIDFKLSNIFDRVIILDDKMNHIDYISSSENVNLNAGTYIISLSTRTKSSTITVSY